MKKKDYQKREDENLSRWCERIAAMCCGRSLNDVLEMIRDVSVTSYTEGVHAAREIREKFKNG